MASLQMFSNEIVTEFSSDLGLTKNVWFSQVDFDTAYPHVVPLMNNILRTSLIRTLTGNQTI